MFDNKCLQSQAQIFFNFYSQVFAGTVDHTWKDQTGARISQIAEAYKHEEYDGVLNDILVAKLENPFELSKYIGIINLFDHGMEPNGKMNTTEYMNTLNNSKFC